MFVEKTEISEVLLLKPKVFNDERGFFMETWNKKTFEEIGLGVDFVQDNHSRSIKNTLRGIHYQIKNPQGKLVRVSHGEVFDVAIDLRKNSKFFGKWIARRLSAENKCLLWIPPGFGHAFLVLSDFAELQYKCTEFYNPESEKCIIWNDKTINIEWPLETSNLPILSKKDLAGVELN